MTVDLIAAAILAGALIGIALIVIRKLPVLAAIDVAATTTAERKATILEQRLRRKFTSWFTRLKDRGQPIMSRSKGLMGKAQQKLVELQHEYKARSIPVLLNRRQHRKLQSEVQDILVQAELFFKEEEYGAAEEKALHAVRLEPHSVPAFELLGEIYLATKEYQHAREVYAYLLKLAGDSDAVYEHLAVADKGAGKLENAEADLQHAVDLNGTVMRYRLELAQVERALGNVPKAFEQIQAASQLEPNHPKVLDELIEISIVYGKKQYAEDAIKTIEETNPDNKKIPEWKERIAAL
jgi:Flp pilus assembly protein TadD